MKKIYIEGENTPNLRQAFSTLLQQELKGQKYKIILGNGISQTVDKFRKAPLDKDEIARYLLVDSDEQITDRADLIKRVNVKCSQKNCKIEVKDGNTFFMEQEVEAWILSQPKALKKIQVTDGLPLNNITSIAKPSEKLAKIYAKNGKTYHKTKEFPKVFKLINSGELKEYSTEYKALIGKLKK